MSMHSNEQNGDRGNSDLRDTESGKNRAEDHKPDYQAPRILSIEPLEVAAAVCDPPTGLFGKVFVPPSSCSTLGS